MAKAQPPPDNAQEDAQDGGADDAQESPQGAAPPSGGGSATELVTTIHSALLQLQAMLGKSQAITPADKQALSSITDAFSSFVKDNLGQGSGQDKAQEQTPVTGGASMEAGMADVKPSY